MSDPTHTLLDSFAQQTRASREDVDRLRDDLDAHVRDATRRVSAQRWWEAGRWWWGATALAAAAAAAVFVILLPREQPEITVSARLEAGEDGGHFDIGDAVHLTYSGDGMIQGSNRQPLIAWEQGQIRIDVDPDAGIDLSVDTREARIHVIGTVFSVNRDALGTRVRVERGRVQVGCNSGAESPVPAEGITANQQVTCLPVTAGALLGRARALQTAGATPAAVLQTIDRGLTLDAGSAISNELAVLRISTLSETGDVDEALRAAQAYLDSGSTQRRDQVVRLATRLALSITDCGAALPHLEALQSEADPAISARLAACR